MASGSPRARLSLEPVEGAGAPALALEEGKHGEPADEVDATDQQLLAEKRLDVGQAGPGRELPGGRDAVRERDAGGDRPERVRQPVERDVGAGNDEHRAADAFG